MWRQQTTLSDGAGASGSVVVSVFQSRMNGNSAPQQPQKLDIATATEQACVAREGFLVKKKKERETNKK